MEIIKKEYIIPTLKWYKPLKELMYYRNRSYHYSQLKYSIDAIYKKIRNEKIIIKITHNDILLNTQEYIYKQINKSPYIIKYYCFLHYNKYNIDMTEDQKQLIGIKGEMVSFDIIKKYNSLKILVNTLNMRQMIKYLKLLLLVQIELFIKYNFIHGNIHNGNIYITKLKKEKTCNFYFNKIKVKIKTDTLLQLGDFDGSVLINQLSIDKCDYHNTLESNIYKTFYCFIELLKNNNDKNRILRILNADRKDRDTIEIKQNSINYFISYYNSIYRIETNSKIQNTWFMTLDKYKRSVLERSIEIIEILFEELFYISFYKTKI